MFLRSKCERGPCPHHVARRWAPRGRRYFTVCPIVRGTRARLFTTETPTNREAGFSPAVTKQIQSNEVNSAYGLTTLNNVRKKIIYSENLLEKLPNEKYLFAHSASRVVSRRMEDAACIHSKCNLNWLFQEVFFEDFVVRFVGEDEKTIGFIAGITRSSAGDRWAIVKIRGIFRLFFSLLSFPSRTDSSENKAECGDQRGYNEWHVSFEKSRSRVPIRGLLTPQWMADEMGRDWVRSRVAVSQGPEMENHESC